MTIIVILEIVLGIVVLNHKSDVNHYVRNKALQSFDRYVHDQSSYGSYSNPSTDTLLWDRFQHNVRDISSNKIFNKWNFCTSHFCFSLAAVATIVH